MKKGCARTQGALTPWDHINYIKLFSQSLTLDFKVYRFFKILFSGLCLVRTNEMCRRYSEACIEVCKELDVKVIDLFTAIQKRDDWANVCF